MSEISDVQKRIYNLWLEAYRKNNNQPFRAKIDFKKTEKDAETITYLGKIESVFKKYPAFFSKTYFDAPYKIYPDDAKYYTLKFFSTQRGISTCIAYLKILRDGNPSEQHQFLKDSFKFITEFCLEKGITLEKYTSYCSVAQRDCLRHLKEHKISWYCIFGVPDFYDILCNLPSDEFELYYGNDVNITNLYDRYKSSAVTVELVSKMKDIVSKFLRKNLHTSTK